MILVVGSKFATKKPLHVKSQKFEFYISWRGLFKQLWVLYFRLCAISLLSAVCSCAWLLLSKVIYHLKVHAYFDPHDNIQASDIMYLYFSWLSDDPYSGLIDISLINRYSYWSHRTLIMRLAAYDLNQQSTLTCTLQNGGEEKAVAWNNRAF